MADRPTSGMCERRTHDDLGVAHTWGDGPELIFLSNPLADPVAWSAGVRDELLTLGYRVTTFEHQPSEFDWQSVVASVATFVGRRQRPVAVVGWSQGAAIAQEVALACRGDVQTAVLLATYGRQSEIDTVLQQSWDYLADEGDDSVRLALGLLTAFPPERLADDEFVRSILDGESGFADKPDLQARQRAGRFIATYQDRLAYLTDLAQPCLVMGFELDTDTFAARAREVAQAIPAAQYIELAGLGHSAPMSDPDLVWPEVVSFLRQYFPPQ